jgi:hypothetical protein
MASIVTMSEMHGENLYARFDLQSVSQVRKDWRGDVT